MARVRKLRGIRPLGTFRPLVFQLEDRLPPGDVFHAGLGVGIAADAILNRTDAKNQAPRIAVVLDLAANEASTALRDDSQVFSGTAPNYQNLESPPSEIIPADEGVTPYSLVDVAVLGNAELTTQLDVNPFESGLPEADKPGTAPATELMNVKLHSPLGDEPGKSAPLGHNVTEPHISGFGTESQTTTADVGPQTSGSNQRPDHRPEGSSGSRFAFNDPATLSPVPVGVGGSPDCTVGLDELIGSAPGYGAGESSIMTLEYNYDPNSCPDQVQTLPGTFGNQDPWDTQALSFSEAPVRYFDGTVKLSFSDLASHGFSTPWGHTRNWTNNAGQSESAAWNRNGLGTVVTQMPYLLAPESPSLDELVAITNGFNAYPFFDCEFCSNVYKTSVNMWLKEILAETTVDLTDVYEMSDTVGNKLYFKQAGLKFFKFVDRYGQETKVVSYSGTKITEVQRTDGTVTESYFYSYFSSGANAGELESVTLRRKYSSTQEEWDPIRKVTFSYYETCEGCFGITNNLKTAKIWDGADQLLDTKYYRYWTGEETEVEGYDGALKFVFEPASYARLVAWMEAETSYDNVDDLSDTEVAPFADFYFAYDSQDRISTEIVQTTGSSRPTTYGRGTFTFNYYDNPNIYPNAPDPEDHNHWAVRTIETLPDHDEENEIVSRNVVYTNAYGEVTLKVYESGIGEDIRQWPVYFRRDDQGRVLLKAYPSSFTKYNGAYYSEDLNDLIGFDGDSPYLLDTAGLVVTKEYVPGTTSDGQDYLAGASVQKGEDGSPIDLVSIGYTSHENGTGDSIFPVAEFTAYSAEGTSGARTTSFTYAEWYDDTHGIKEMTVSWPKVSDAEHGPGTSEAADERTERFNTYGRPEWIMDGALADPGHLIHYLEHDLATGAVTKLVNDVDTTNEDDFDPQEDVPEDWETAEDRGLHIRQVREVDGLGRETRSETTSKDQSTGNVTCTTYDDAAHEMRIYPGWTGTTTTGPTTVLREDRASNPSYVETLTMSAPPDEEDDKPTGEEDIDAVQSLSRVFTSEGGQVSQVDVYHSLNGQTYTDAPEITEEGRYRWTFGYDDHGRPNRTQVPTNTIYLTEYDGLGRVINESVGTTNNNAEVVREYEYDGGPENIGDGNLTKIIEYPSTADNPEDQRVTKLYYDWRNRLVASKAGVDDEDEGDEDENVNRPLFVYAWNNVGDLLMTEQYDGDAVTEAPSPGSADCARDGTGEDDFDLRRSCSSTAYDAQGRPYAEFTYSVDQADGSSSSSDKLTAGLWYDRRGNVIKTVSPGGLVYKTQYDGLGRPVSQFVSEGGGDSDWEDAAIVDSDYILEQTETDYDINSNPIQVTHRARFHDEDDTGALGDHDTAPYARVSYAAMYYDEANRLIGSVNFGTNGASSFTRPSWPVTGSDTELVTSYGYKADEVQTVTLTGGPTSGNFKLNFDGEPTSAIGATAAASTVQVRLEQLNGLDEGDVAVTGPNGGPWTIRFIGTNQGEKNVVQLTAQDISLGGSGGPYGVAIATTSEGGVAGRTQQVVDPRGLIAKTDYDMMGRATRTIENYVNFVPSETDDRTTEFAYDGSDHLTLLTALLPSNAYQKTEYVYGDSNCTGNPIHSNDLLCKVKYPDKSSGSPGSSSSDQEIYKYNALGETKEFIDRNATVHAYSYDVAGRFTTDAVTTLGSGVDTAIQRQTVSYDTAGRAYKFTSWDNDSGGNVVNEVQHAFNGLGQLITEYQEHDDAVNTGSTPKVEYDYTEMAGGANHSRLETMTYPNGRFLHYQYTAGTGYAGIDDRISRVSFLADGTSTTVGTHLEEYAYLGLMTPVKRARPEPDVDLTYVAQSGDGSIVPSAHDPGDKYTGLDRFGRIRDQRWRDTGTGDHTDRFVYGYDPNSNRLYRDNLLNNSYDELYHTNGDTNGYDKFNQLTEFRRGPLSDSGTDDVPDTVSSASRYQTWTLDVMGNWDVFDNNGTTDDRGHNKQNQITSGAPSAQYDSNGNTTEFTESSTARKYVYDAWNRLVKVTNTAGTTTHVAYEHDALGRRIESTADSTTTDLYYSAAWQVLEERIGSATKSQYVWSPLYVDAMILRDRDYTGDSALEERLYVQQDANWNVTTLVDINGDVKERFVYNPYGPFTRLSPSWGSPGTDTYSWVYLHQGGRYDSNSKLYHFRNRDLSPTLGRWMQNDPLGYGGGDSNLYRLAFNNPPNLLDPTGLMCAGPVERFILGCMSYTSILTRISCLETALAAGSTFHKAADLAKINQAINALRQLEKHLFDIARAVERLKSAQECSVRQPAPRKCENGWI